MHLIQMECSQSFRLSLAWIGGPGQTHRPHTPDCLHEPCNCICRMKEGSRSYCDPRIPDSSHHKQTPWGPQPVPLCPLKQQLLKQSLMVLKCKPGRSLVLFMWHSHQGCEGLPLTKQWMFLILSNTWLGGHGRDFKPQVNKTCQSQIHDSCMNC